MVTEEQKLALLRSSKFELNCPVPGEYKGKVTNAGYGSDGALSGKLPDVLGVSSWQKGWSAVQFGPQGAVEPVISCPEGLV